MKPRHKHTWKQKSCYSLDSMSEQDSKKNSTFAVSLSFLTQSIGECIKRRVQHVTHAVVYWVEHGHLGLPLQYLQFFWETFSGQFCLYSDFLPEICLREKNIFLYFIVGFLSNKLTYCPLDYGQYVPIGKDFAVKTLIIFLCCADFFKEN